MAVTAIATTGTTGIEPSYKSPTDNSHQAPKTTKNPTNKADQVALTSQAKAKAMELQGIPVSVIAAKLGVDAKTVNQYLGVTDTTKSDAPNSTYTQPKSTNAEDKSTTTAAIEPFNKTRTTTADTAKSEKTASNTTKADETKSKSSESKSTYVEPKTTYTEPQSLTKDRTKLTNALAKLATIPHN